MDIPLKLFLVVRSPIERAFLSALVPAAKARGAGIEIGNAVVVVGTPHLLVMPQQKVGERRVDFLVSRGSLQAVVECDGHRYHRTKDAQASDRQYDRWCQRAGILMFRFTGVEINSNALRCAHEVLQDVLGAP